MEAKQITVQVNRVKKKKKKGLKLVQGPFLIFKIYLVSFLPQAPHKEKGNYFPHSNFSRTTTCPPTSKQIRHMIRHHLGQPKVTENGIP
jgi:hypothetical protein